MNAVIKTYCHVNMPVTARKMTAASHNLCLTRNVLITKNNVIFVSRKLSSRLTKGTLQLSACRPQTFGPLCRFAAAQSCKPSVPLNGKYVQRCRRRCSVSVAVAVGLLVGWAALELHRCTVSCVAEATETAECHDDNEQTNQQCQIVSLDEAICESDQLLQRVKVIGKD